MTNVLETTEVIRRQDNSAMVLIPGGQFWMGADNGSDAERPIHEVWVDPFWIDETPVTNQQFEAFVTATGYQTTAEKLYARVLFDESTSSREQRTWRTFATKRADHPVVMVSWNDAASFANWAGKRLLTEAEWEKAARGGLCGKLYPWGDEEPSAAHVCWQGAQDKGPMPATAPVASFPPNGYGAYDMSGNVWEWCNDWYRDPYYFNCPSHNPEGPSSGQFKVRRGAAWNVREAFRLRCSNRGAMLPDRYWPNIGFRCGRGV